MDSKEILFESGKMIRKSKKVIPESGKYNPESGNIVLESEKIRQTSMYMALIFRCGNCLKVDRYVTTWAKWMKRDAHYLNIISRLLPEPCSAYAECILP